MNGGIWQRLTGPQFKVLRDLLLEAFSPTDFDNMLRFQLDLRRSDLTLANNQSERVRDVIEHFNYRNQTGVLVSAARKSRPDDPELQAYARQFSAAMQLPERLPTELALERVINQAIGYFEPRFWREQMARLENQVCRIEVLAPKPATGTGFLLGSDVVMTNYHVVEAVIKQQVVPEKVRLRFDYALLSDGLTPNPGVLYTLASDWLIAKSEYSLLDLLTDPPEDPGPDQLDYALLRVADAPGNDPPGGAANQDPDAPPRGWIQLPQALHNFDASPLMMIMQHPEGRPLKLALDSAAIIGVNSTGTRVRHRVNTDAGSSGSPCFDAHWNLIALHHAGDPNYEKLHKPTYNQAIPIAAILESLGETQAELDR